VSLGQTSTFWATAILYVVATLMAFAALAWKSQKWLGRSIVVATCGLVMHAAAIGWRWYDAGHFPYVGTYEGILFGTFVTVAAVLGLGLIWRQLRYAVIVVLPVTLLTMGYALTRPSAAGPVEQVYDSPWLLLHFTFSWTTYALYTVVAALSIFVLLRAYARRKGRDSRLVPSWVPDDARIEQISLPIIGFAFLNNAVSIASGSIWAYRLWGSYWSWDPVEMWSLLTWLAYGFYLHARLTLGWKGTKLAWVAVLSLFGMMMATWGVQLVPTSYHLFRNIGGDLLGGSGMPR
jgi:cytochrome c-type biogenesis protein CcsB